MAITTQQLRAIERMQRELTVKTQKAFSALHAAEAIGQEPSDKLVDFCNALDEMVVRMQTILSPGTEDERREQLWKEWEPKVTEALQKRIPAAIHGVEATEEAEELAPSASTTSVEQGREQA
jgi:hypothetical protein